MGVQIFISCYGMMICAAGFFSNYMLRPYVLTLSLVWLAAMGWVNGFITSRVLKFFGSIDWFFCAIISAFLLPMWLITTAGFIDIIEWIEGSSSVVPFSTFFFYCLVWLIITIPLTFHGAYVGFGCKPTKKVCKVNSVRRNIPPQPFFLSL